MYHIVLTHIQQLVDALVVAFLLLLLWGALGWASQAPQQHTLFSLEPEHGAAAVALNSSANYIGSAIGATLGGITLEWGFLPANLPYLAGTVALLAVIGQLVAIYNPLKRRV